jgi:hypothetical protein
MVTTPQQAPSSGTTGPDGTTGPGGPDGPDGTGAGDVVPGPSYEPMSIKAPALIVLGLAVVILLGGVAAAALTSSTNPTFTIRHVTLADGTTVALVPAADALHAIVNNGEPPDDIIGNLGIARESKVTGVINSDQHTAQFDRTVKLTSQLAQSQVAEAYRRMLAAAGWKVIFQGAAPQAAVGSTEVLATHGSGDGFYWETGVVVSPTTAAGATPYSVEIFETPDGN